MAFAGFESTAPATTGGFGGFGSTTPAAGGFGGFGSAAKPAATTSGFGGFGAAATPSATAPSTAFGTAAPASTGASTTGFGFGSAAQAKPAGGFGFGTSLSTPAASAKPDAAPSFGGFGTTTPAPAAGTSGFGGFAQAKPAATGFGGFGSPTPTTGATGFGAAATPSFGGFGSTLAAPTAGAFGTTGQSMTGGLAAPAALVPTSMAESVCELPLDTMYNDLPAGYKAEIDRTWKDLKQPMTQKLEEISRSRGSIFDDVHAELRKVHLAVLQVENEQRRLQGEIRPFLAELRQTSETGRLQAAIGLQQIRKQDVGTLLTAAKGSETLRSMIDEDLPCKWYLMVAEQLSRRLSRCAETISSYERQLATRLKALEQSAGLSLSRGSYGQVRRVGLADLVVLVQEQARVFLHVASTVAQVHQEVDALRQGYLEMIGASPSGTGRSGKAKVENPFEAADRKDAAEQRVLEQKMQAESQKYHQQKQQAQQPAQAATTGAPAQTVGFGGTSSGFGAGLSAPLSFGTPAATPAAGGFGAPATGATGFGGFGSPAPASTTTPAPATGGFGGFGGFGATTTPAAPAASGFGAPAAGGFGSVGTSQGNKSSFAALDLATPNNTAAGFGGFGAAATTGAAAASGFGAPAGGAANPFGGFATSQAPALGSSNPNRRGKKK